MDLEFNILTKQTDESIFLNKIKEFDIHSKNRDI